MTKYKPCISLEINEESNSVNLNLDTSVATYSEWIEGEGGDICLYRAHDDNRVLGIRLPLYKKNLVVLHKGAIRINTGFRIQEDEIE